jgi:hypothetical protein
MKVMISKLLEGGNVFKTLDKQPLTQRIATKDVPATIDFIEQITGLDFTKELDPDDKKPVKWLGTTGRKEDPDGTFDLNSSGDLDLSVDAREITKEELIAKLADWCRANGVEEEDIFNKGTKKNDGWIKDAGDNVHFRTPINGSQTNGFVQADFMLTVNPKFQQGSMIGGRGQYRGEHRHIVLSSIARARGFKYSPKFGLLHGDTNEPVENGDDWNVIAKQLLGQTATTKDVKSVDGIIAYIIKLPNYDELVAGARETLGKQGIELPVKEAFESYIPGSNAWMRRMINIVK